MEEFRVSAGVPPLHANGVRLSVIIPTCNRGAKTVRATESVLA